MRGRGHAPALDSQARLRVWRRGVAKLCNLRWLRKRTRALTVFLRSTRGGGALHWRRPDRLPAEIVLREDRAVEHHRWHLVLKALGRWRARTYFARPHVERRRRQSFFSSRRSCLRRVLESETLRAATLRLLARLLRWLVSGRGAGPVGAALGAAGTALLLEGPAGAGTTGDNATATDLLGE